ncbi:hypothetical protein [Arcobacter sp. LA11]|uniref:hypothetical protein n=1 Tax=Arcobacter sp. LA11 TaxID=1898176 RepID=UPI000932D110|nr:hypothetical protein [Arcobacter sp. LA11]
MRIDNNIHAMTASAVQIDKLATNLADVANTVGEPENQEVTQDLIDSIVGQIPEVISYEANAKGIETQNAVADVLLNIKA